MVIFCHRIFWCAGRPLLAWSGERDSVWRGYFDFFFGGWFLVRDERLLCAVLFHYCAPLEGVIGLCGGFFGGRGVATLDMAESFFGTRWWWQDWVWCEHRRSWHSAGGG